MLVNKKWDCNKMTADEILNNSWIKFVILRYKPIKISW